MTPLSTKTEVGRFDKSLVESGAGLAPGFRRFGTNVASESLGEPVLEATLNTKLIVLTYSTAKFNGSMPVNIDFREI